MQTWSRKRREAVFLGVIAVLSITPMRWPIENRYLFLAEFLLVAIFAVVAGWKQSRAANYFAVAMTLVPVLFAFLARSFTTPVAFELTALTCFGTLSVAIALSAKTDRTRAMSLVVGGFLVLFCASISDERSAIVYPLLWMTGCVWHLVANHWERLDLAMPETVTSTWKLRPTTVAVALLLLGVVGYGLKDSFSDSGKLNLGIMPTSGGSAWSDPAARSGVGSGDAAIAAKDHAESFGAVDSDIFLESTESTLFDMVNDLLGEPVKKKNVWERRQAMHNENVIPMHSKAAKTEKGSGSFSTERMPPPKHRHFRDANSNAIMQWDGSTGTRLAMQRYDTFDGTEWTQTADIGRTQLLRRVIEDQHWFFDPKSWHRMQRESDSVSVSLLKVLKLNSVRIPVPMQTCGLHIKEVDRIDFFGISKDGSMEMPGREKIPDLTVFHVASLLFSEDVIREGLRDHSGTPVPPLPEEWPITARLQREVYGVVDRSLPRFDQLRSMVDYLRDEYVVDLESSDETSSLSTFIDQRSGGSHLFATAAALMARELGFRSRLVKGFYVRPGSFDLAAGHADILPGDIHFWTEIQLEDGRWFEIEPTPGFRQPNYKPSLRLLAMQFLSRYWLAGTGISLALVAAWFSRRIWCNALLALIWKLSAGLGGRRRLRLAMTIIESRAKLAGAARPSGVSQRAWLQTIGARDPTIGDAARQFCDVADSVFFGSKNDVPSSATRLVELLPLRIFIQLEKGAPS